MTDIYIKLSTMEYPRHIGDIELDPLGATNYAPVIWVDAPIINPEIEQIIGELPPVNIEGLWYMQWEVKPLDNISPTLL